MSEGVWLPVADVAVFLDEKHYLGAAKRGLAYRDAFGVIVVAQPTARRLPQNWLDLTRWCITSEVPNAGSRQWRSFRKALATRFPNTTTVVSYSDPSVGHTGALYRACNWWWCPTWLRLRPPPSGNGSWAPGKQEAVKDRWVFPLQPDPQRVFVLTAKDESVLRRMPWARYKEPGGADYRRFVQ